MNNNRLEMRDQPNEIKRYKACNFNPRILILLIFLLPFSQVLAQSCSGYLAGPVSGICAGQTGRLTFAGANSSVSYVLYLNGNLIGSQFSGSNIYQWDKGPGSYYVKGVSSGCSSYQSATVVIGVATAGALSISTGSQSTFFCAGTSVTLTPGGGNSYAWSASPSDSHATGSGSITVTPIDGQTYTLYGNELTCNQPTQTSITFHTSPPVGQVSIVTGNNSVCQGSTTAYTTGNTPNVNYYTWSISPSSAGTVTSSIASGVGTGTVSWSSSFTGQATVSIIAYSATNCSATTSTSMNVNVVGNSIGQISVSPLLICGTSGMATITLASLTTGNASWQYQYSDDGGNTFSPTTTTQFSQVVGLTANVALTTNNSGASPALRIYRFQVTATNSPCPVQSTGYNAQVKVSPIPDLNVPSQTLFVGSSTNITGTVPGTTLSYSVANGSNNNVNGAVGGTGSSIVQPLNLTDGVNPGGVTYYVTPTANGCTGTPRYIPVSVYPLPVITTSPNTNRLNRSPITLSSQNFYDMYTWTQLSNGIQTGLGSAAGLNSISARSSGTYSLSVIKNSVSSSPVSINIIGQFDGQLTNYVVENDFLVSGVAPTDLVDILPIESVSQQIKYFDGLGRPIQVVSTQASPNKQDIVTPNSFDDFGRQDKKYLAYPSQSTNGFYQTTGVADQAAFYGTSHPNIANDVAISQTVFEPSPLNRVAKQGAPGAVWQPDNNLNSTTDHTIKYHYETNGATDVILFSYDPTTGYITTGSNSQPAYYQAGQLQANRTTDEHQNSVISYVDKEGRTICKKILSGGTDPSGNPLYASTYYVYDSLGNLIVVLPPEAVRRGLKILIKN